MRITIRGGTWLNTEDEVLKAGVMKYGLHQWGRVASLLPRKSAKQCRARWKEWLDPSVKKTEWSREEDERLLHLAKLMPTQWRTIAPVVGRTATQCLERYEKLLDEAQQREGAGDEDDPRRLRPGEVDPMPETKPAKPDTVDLDDDEIEMLGEARARLANTKGKKAKRLARERGLSEARRLAALQKRRELRAAGIHGRQRRKLRPGEVDFAHEIPELTKPPPGFFDTTSEVAKERSTKVDLTGRLVSDFESRGKEKKRKKPQGAAEKAAAAEAAAAAIFGDDEPVVKRTKLALPEPQISEADFDEISRAAAMAVTPVVDAGGLVGPYPAATPVPRATPTPAAAGRTPRAGQTPVRYGAGQTPVRDQLSINPAATPGGRLESGVQAALLGLPEPQQVAGPKLSLDELQRLQAAEEADGEADDEEDGVLDAEEIARRKLAVKQAREAELRALRSSAVQRGLPRPIVVNSTTRSDGVAASGPEQLIQAEMIAMLQYDSHAHPLHGAPMAVPEYEMMSKDALDAARDLLHEELALVQLEHSDAALPSPDELRTAWTAVFEKLMYLPSKKGYDLVSNASKRDQQESIEAMLEADRTNLERDWKRAGRLEKKLDLTIKEHVAQATAARDEIGRLHDAIRQAQMELGACESLAETEAVAVPGRVDRWEGMVRAQAEREQALQGRYKELVEQREALKAGR